MSSCVFCDSSDNLNTINIKGEEGDIAVWVCEQHAEEATLKEIKEAYYKKHGELENLKKQAFKLGYKLVPLETQTQTQTQTQSKELKESKEQIERPATRPIKNLPQPRVRAAAGVAGMASPHTIAVKNTKGEVVHDEIVEAQVLTSKTRPGLVIPKKIKGDSGETTISIVPTSNADLDHRGEASQPYDNYHLKDCTTCGATGILTDGSPCPRCSGRGVVSKS